jgi:hypothetical protein
MRYTPKTIHEVRRCIAGFSGQTRVEVEGGIPVKAKTVADLRTLSSWPPGDWVLDVPINGDQQHSAVTVEWPSYTSL